MLSLWARITGADKKKTFPEQQTSALNRSGNAVVVYPHCLYVDLPNNALVREISDGVAIPVTVNRPADLARGEPAFFHPETNTRIIIRNDESLEILNNNGRLILQADGEFNINGARITTAGDVVTASGVSLDNHTHNQGADSRGDSQATTNPPNATE